MTAPNRNQTSSDMSVPDSWENSSSSSSWRGNTVPKAMPATKAATKPLVPASTDEE